MPGTIAYLSREEHVPPLFATLLAQTMREHSDCRLVWSCCTDVADGRNKAVAQMQGDWLWFVDSDQVFTPDLLDKLLARDVDIVQALCLLRASPHRPLVYSESTERKDERLLHAPGLFHVKQVGAGGTLYRRKVFETIEAPWFEGPLGQEDLALSRKAHAAGFEMYVDTENPIGHLTQVAVFPRYSSKGKWHAEYVLLNGDRVVRPEGI